MQGIRGSFLGFTYNNIHSSVIGITRSNSGDRFEGKLIPTLKDRAVDRLSTDGQFFYGSTYQKREFKVDFAFEEMTESQMEKIKREWNDKKIHDLIFDEEPYKVYSAKLTGNSMLKHLAFDKSKTERVYHGEGTFVFTCYFPFARSRYEYQEDYTVDNIHEWIAEEEEIVLQDDANMTLNSLLAPARVYYDFIDNEEETVNAKMVSNEAGLDWVYDDSLLQESDQTIDETDSGKFSQGLLDSDYNNFLEWIGGSRIPSNLNYGKYSGGAYKLFNAGDMPIPFKIWFVAAQTNGFTLSCGDNSISVNGLQQIRGDYYYVFDVDTHSIEGYDSSGKPTGTTYNYGIAGGDFFLLPVGEQFLRIVGAQPHKIEFHYWYL